MAIPGSLWSAIYIILAMLPLWLEQYFPGVIWVAPAAGLLAIILKVWEVYKPQDAPAPQPPGEFSAGPAVSQTSKTRRFLLG
jgi:hypothetical protein